VTSPSVSSGASILQGPALCTGQESLCSTYDEYKLSDSLSTANYILIHIYTAYTYLFIYSPVAQRPNAGHSLLILQVSRSHTMNQSR